MSIELSLGITDKVSAINAILSAIGMVGVNTEDDIEYNVDAGDADKLIDRISQDIQSNGGKGYWFNRESFHKLQPNATTGVTTAPSNAMSVLIPRDVNNGVTAITLRGRKLFDPIETGYDMRPHAKGDGLIHCTIIVNLPFDTLPATAKSYIVDACRFWMVNDKEGDTVKLESLKSQILTSMTRLENEESSQKRRNAFNNPYTRNTLFRIGGYNNN